MHEIGTHPYHLQLLYQIGQVGDTLLFEQKGFQGLLSETLRVVSFWEKSSFLSSFLGLQKFDKCLKLSLYSDSPFQNLSETI